IVVLVATDHERAVHEPEAATALTLEAPARRGLCIGTLRLDVDFEHKARNAELVAISKCCGLVNLLAVELDLPAPERNELGPVRRQPDKRMTSADTRIVGYEVAVLFAPDQQPVRPDSPRWTVRYVDHAAYTTDFHPPTLVD